MTFTDLIIGMMEASKERIDKMNIEQTAAKYQAKAEDVRFWRDHWRNLK